ncbi:MAG: DUF3016 domain-containing protein [Arenimonas sp.]|nr:DUF3016 domain-containing protein [Arenimonas sp.]MBP6310368.1 DUF3016 domain-containing protein [Arenimonas sp.]
MPIINAFKISVVLLAITFANTSHAGEAIISWGDMATFTDIDPTNTSKKNFNKSLQRSFDDELTKLAKKLPQGYSLSMHIRNIDLAGKVNTVASANGKNVRVLAGNFHPMMIFDFKVTDSGGAIVLEQSNYKIQDLNYFYSALSVVAASTNFYYEFNMLDKWFKADVLTKVQ